MDKCSKFFTFSDFLKCSDTFKKHESLDNTPKEAKTFEWLSKLSTTILDPLVEHFGEIEITYGFSSEVLAKEIKKNPLPGIKPDIDQHASFELNQKGERICKRGGAACDIFSNTTDAKELTLWILENVDFDRIYFYGINKPLHISINEKMSNSIYLMKKIDLHKKIPINCNKNNFLSKLKFLNN